MSAFFVISLLSASGFYFISAKETIKVSLAHVEFQQSHIIYAEARGQIGPANEYFPTVNHGGKLDELYVQEGMAVKKGQILGVLDAMSAKGSLQSAFAAYKLSMVEFGRVQHLLQSDSVTKADYDTASSVMSVKKAELQQARDKVEDAIIRSHIDGIVSYVAFQKDDIVPSGSRVLVIADESSHKLTTSFPIALANLIPRSGEVDVSPFDLVTHAMGTTHKVRATVTQDPPSNEFQKTDVDVAFHFPELPEGLHSGESVKVSVPVQNYTDVSVVDKRAIVKSESEKKLVLIGPHGHLHWFTPQFGFDDPKLADKCLVLNLPKDSRVVIPDLVDLKLVIEDRIAVKVRSEPKI